MDYALIATEIIHYSKCKRSSLRGDATLKLDINKAYDRVIWDYLREIMLKIGFDGRWVRWMMMHVASVQYSVLLNNDKTNEIIPGRALRQGNPLSPYLYIICTEGLYSLIKKAVSSGQIHGIKICRGLLLLLISFLRMIVSSL